MNTNKPAPEGTGLPLRDQYATALHVVNHSGPCGERVLSPHQACNEKVGPYYHVAERLTRTRTSIGYVCIVVWRCHGCAAVWQESVTA